MPSPHTHRRHASLDAGQIARTSNLDPHPLDANRRAPYSKRRAAQLHAMNAHVRRTEELQAYMPILTTHQPWTMEQVHASKTCDRRRCISTESRWSATAHARALSSALRRSASQGRSLDPAQRERPVEKRKTSHVGLDLSRSTQDRPQQSDHIPGSMSQSSTRQSWVLTLSGPLKVDASPKTTLRTQRGGPITALVGHCRRASEYLFKPLRTDDSAQMSQEQSPPIGDLPVSTDESVVGSHINAITKCSCGAAMFYQEATMNTLEQQQDVFVVSEPINKHGRRFALDR